MRIDKKFMVGVLHQEHAFSEMFVAYLLTRNIGYESDTKRIWLDQLFNSGEKRRLALFSCLLTSASRESPKLQFPKSVKKL
jgi:hypothetical protein